ncbi:MAG: M48 family metalloprotease [Halioglobus sp.]
MNTRAKLIFIFCLTILSTALPGCSSNPATGSSDITIMTQGKEVSIGEEMHNKMMAEGADYKDPELQEYVNRIGQRLASNSDSPDMAFTFTIIDSPDINAFATPGGFIYINRGLMAYLDNEAELAGVLSHEIGHITARHSARQQTASITNQVLATTAYILTGSGDIADASTMYGTELVRGYGRDHELEADGLGAEYMHKSGYDSAALLEVIGVLKDQEQYQRVKAKATGKSVATYHGLYATHPRNDQRLQTVIRKGGELELDEQVENPAKPGEFKRQMEALVWGASVQDTRSQERYYHNKLAFTFIQPEGWSVDAGSQAILATADDGSASLRVTLKRRDTTASAKSVIEATTTGTLSIGKELDQAGLKGYTAVASNGAVAHRLAAIDYSGYTYFFEGKAGDFTANDAQLVSIIESFRPLHPKERATGAARYIHYIQVPRGATMATLAAGIRISDAEAQLRLLNGLYPRGEPRTGDWIKVIR